MLDWGLTGAVAVSVHGSPRPERDLPADPKEASSPRARPPRGRALPEPVVASSFSRRYPDEPFLCPSRRPPPRGVARTRLRYGRTASCGQRRGKRLENLASSLPTGGQPSQMRHLAELPLDAVAVEGRYAALLTRAHAPAAGWLISSSDSRPVIRKYLSCFSTLAVTRRTGRTVSSPQLSPTARRASTPVRAEGSPDVAMPRG